MSAQAIGFVGLGRMGSAMATRLLDAGYGLAVFDTNEEALAPLLKQGAVKAASPAEVASIAEIVLASLPMPDIVRNVALGAEGIIHGDKVKTFVDLSTTGSRVSMAVAEGLAARGIVAIDAPVSGGVAGAQKGTLAVMASGPRESYAKVEPLLKYLGKVFFVGEAAGMAQTLKLINNLLAATALAVTSEAMVMGVKAGLDPKTMIEIINISSGRNSATQDKFPRAVLPRTFDFGFATGLSRKDVALCLAEAEALGIPMIVGNATHQVLMITEAMFGADSDFTSMVKVAERWADAEVRG
jgi:3-hydroxyisobutyrate dehydrogenase-like beta-hydroxyacid dehydrogenase